MWHGEVVQLDSERYRELQSAGWEPTNFLLVPDPRPKQGLATPNGDGGVAQSFVTFVGMKIWTWDRVQPRDDCGIAEPHFGVGIEGMMLARSNAGQGRVGHRRDR